MSTSFDLKKTTFLQQWNKILPAHDKTPSIEDALDTFCNRIKKKQTYIDIFHSVTLCIFYTYDILNNIYIWQK